MLFATPPLSITDVPANAAHQSAGRLGYDYIVLHHSGGTDSRAWLSRTSNPPVSCHRLISRSCVIYTIVPDHLVAFTQGPADIGPIPENGQNVNQWALSIEFENLGDGQDYPTAQLWSGAQQVVEWWGAHGWLAMVYHKQIQGNKHDPFDFPRAQFDALVRDALWKVLR
jgi:N-acetyl-anhydromuramyl-L-alanine amidase AmpD